MIEITKEITVDLTRKNKTRVIFAKQLDNGCRKILVTLTDNGKEYSVPQDAVVTVNVLRSDGESNAFLAAVTKDGRLEATLGSWTLGVAGETKCSFSLYFDGNKRLSTPEIILEVGAELYTGDGISSDQNYSILTALISDCSEIKEAESGRIVEEISRSNAEKLRVANEEKRISNENTRNQKETERIQREKARIEAESARAAAESARVENENRRNEAEEERQAVIGELDSALDHILNMEDVVTSGEILLATAYPVGAIYTSVNSTSPALLFGGTWERLEDKFLLGANDANAGTMGGDSSHSHSSGTMRAQFALDGSSSAKFHYKPTANAGAWTAEKLITVSSSTSSTTSRNAGIAVDGDTTSASHMPPYLAVYMWKRTA